MDIILDSISGISWSLVYLTSIIIGISKKTWCIPRTAICQNFAWEFWIVLAQIQSSASMRVGYVVQIVWLILDIGVLAVWLWHDRKKTGINILLLVIFLGVMYVLAYRAGNWKSIAFLINAIMSGLFLLRIQKEPGVWISLTIAIGKLFGTLAATMLSGILYPNMLILWLGGICFILDCAYLVKILLLRQGA